MNAFLDGLGDLGDLAGKAVRARVYLEMCERDRNTKIVELLVAGHSTREVAAAAGITQARVVQIHTKARNATNQVLDGGASV